MSTSLLHLFFVFRDHFKGDGSVAAAVEDFHAFVDVADRDAFNFFPILLIQDDEAAPGRPIDECYQSSILKYFAKAFSSDEAAYDYLVESIRDWPDQRTIGEMIARNGWASVEYRNLTGSIAALHRAIKPLP